MIPTLIINLAQSVSRKAYMDNLIKEYPNLSVTYVGAVYGKSLSQSQLDNCFDMELSYKRYGKKLNSGEIGCTLSHFKCYQQLLSSPNNFTLILEDDITIIRDISNLEWVIPLIDNDIPTVILLSGDYWYYSKRTINNEYEIATVLDAVGTYSYFINKAAAKLITQKNPRPSNVADNWSLYKSQGVKIKAIYPYMIDANISAFESNIKQEYFGECRKNMSLSMVIKALVLSFSKHLLNWRNHFVSKIREPLH